MFELYVATGRTSLLVRNYWRYGPTGQQVEPACLRCYLGRQQDEPPVCADIMWSSRPGQQACVAAMGAPDMRADETAVALETRARTGVTPTPPARAQQPIRARRPARDAVAVVAFDEEAW